MKPSNPLDRGLTSTPQCPQAHFIDEKTEAPEVAEPGLGPGVLSSTTLPQTTLHTGSLKSTFIHVKKNPKRIEKECDPYFPELAVSTQCSLGK